MASSHSSLDKEINKCRIIQGNSREISDEILEIQQIEYEQHLILEEINRIDAEKKRLQDLLNLVQSLKSNVNSDTYIEMSHTQNLPFTTQNNIAMMTHAEANRYPELLRKGNREDDKILEIKQIECEQRLIVERILRLELHKKRLQNLLNELQALDSDDDDDDDD